jgi:uncharacterized protein (DUF305 family)
MRHRIKPVWLIAATLAVAALAAATISAFRSPADDGFAVENRAAMDKMMARMHAGRSGNVDRDFAAMMIAHHQGAIDMALAELRHGRNEQLRRLAQAIVIEQQQEIAAMQAVLDEELTVLDGAVALASLCRSRRPD